MANDGAGTAARLTATVPELREIPEAIQWHEGMLLSPQHFQQQAARWEGLLQSALLAQNPFAWGLRQLRLDLSVLPAGRFRVRQLEAAFPDGSAAWFEASADAGAALELDLAAALAAYPGHALTIYLTVPVRTPASAHGEGARFQSVPGGAVVDENTGEGTVAVPRLRPRLGLMAGDPPPARFCALPIAQVEQRDEAFALTDYLPPTLTVAPDSALHQMCAAVAQRLRAKALFLAERARAPSVAALTPVVWESKRQIHSLVTALPPFEALLASGQPHPWTLYLSFCALAGHVAALADSLQPPLLPPYRHDDMLTAFVAVRDFVLRAVREGVSDAYLAIPMERRDGVFSLRCDAAWTQRRLVIGIRRPAGASEADMVQWGQQCLAAAEEVIPALREKRILGLRRQLLGPGDELAAGAGEVLFELSPDPVFLAPDRVLQVLNMGGGAAGPAAIMLYVRTPEA